MNTIPHHPAMLALLRDQHMAESRAAPCVAQVGPGSEVVVRWSHAPAPVIFHPKAG